jgi:hypothetical protein
VLATAATGVAGVDPPAMRTGSWASDDAPLMATMTVKGSRALIKVISE